LTRQVAEGDGRLGQIEWGQRKIEPPEVTRPDIGVVRDAGVAGNDRDVPSRPREILEGGMNVRIREMKKTVAAQPHVTGRKLIDKQIKLAETHRRELSL
jgi:hypothetical protein